MIGDKELKIFTVVTGQLCFLWEVEVLINSLRDRGLSHLLNVLVEKETSEDTKEIWIAMRLRYSEVSFSFWSTKEIEKLKGVYISVIRPHILKQYFKFHSYLEKDCILYLDSDILITNDINFDNYIDDDINYCSATPYISASYFESKEKDVMSFKKKEYLQRDILGEICKVVGIDKQIVIDNEKNTGGCQYLLKNIDYKFWEDVERDCINLVMKCRSINGEFFSSEERGFQSWAIGDMCGVLWNLWKRGAKTECPEELNFNWATTPVEDWDKNKIFHNAGITGHYLDKEKTIKMFYKGDPRFKMSLVTPWELEYEGISDKYCGKKYLDYILSIKNPVSVVNNKKKY